MDGEPASHKRIKGISAKVDAGTLPRAGKGRTLAARGSGRACSACDQPVGRTEMELQSTLNTGRTLRLHLECFTAWWKVSEARRGMVAL
jgi:hypothetical protein